MDTASCVDVESPFKHFRTAASFAVKFLVKHYTQSLRPSFVHYRKHSLLDLGLSNNQNQAKLGERLFATVLSRSPPISS